MKIRIIISLMLLPVLVDGQVSFSPLVTEKLEQAKVLIRPYYYNLIYHNYRDIEVKTPSDPEVRFGYDWAVEHKTLPLELWLHIMPGTFAFTNGRVDGLADDLNVSYLSEINPYSDDLIERSRCSVGHWARVDGIDPDYSDKSGAIIMSSYKENCGMIEFFMVYDNDYWDKVKEEIYTMMLAFCFRPEPKDDESAGVGVKIGFNHDKLMFWFQEVGKDAGAYNAGFLPGDLIITIDGKEDIFLEDIYSVTSMLKGPEGTEVEVEVLRDGLQYESKIKRGKFNPEQVTFLTTGAWEVALERIRGFSEFILYADDVLDQKGSEAGKDPLGNQQWEFNIKFPGEFPGILTHNSYLFDRYEISYRLTNEENSEKSEEIYNTYKSVFTEAMGDEYDMEEETVDDNIVRFRITDPEDIIDGNSIVLTLDKTSYDKSFTIGYIFPQ